MAEEIEWWDFDAAEDLIDAVVGDVSFIIESALDARGQALVAFPGGSTPKPILEKLAQANIRWKSVTIIPTDDRLVPVDNALSNVAMIAKIFRKARVFCQSPAMLRTINWPEVLQTPGLRTCIGHPILSGWVWARMGIPRRYSRDRISKPHSKVAKMCAPLALRQTRCRPKLRSSGSP